MLIDISYLNSDERYALTEAWVASPVETQYLAMLALIADQHGYEWRSTATGEIEHSKGAISYSPGDAKRFYDQLWTQDKEALRWSAANILTFYGYTFEDLMLNVSLVKS
jgi:hypothetical protein